MAKRLESHIFYGITVSFPQTLLAVKMINYDVCIKADRCMQQVGALFFKEYATIAAPSRSIQIYGFETN